MAEFEYIREPDEIYRLSFETIQSEVAVDQLCDGMRAVAIRLIHACGMVDVIEDLAYSKDAVASGLSALRKGSPIFTDVEMVKSGIIRSRLKAENPLICTLNAGEVPEHARKIGNTRSAAAVDYWEQLEGSVVAIGNAPTALFRLMERVMQEGIKPALVIGIPVGFVGAVESKQALVANSLGIEYITVHGRRGGSAMASAAVNALAGVVQ